MKAASTIIVYFTGQLGDTLVTLPAMRALRAAFPESDFVLLTAQNSGKGVSPWDVLGPTSLFVDVLFYEPINDKFQSLPKLLQLARRIRKVRPKAFFYLRDPHWESRDRDRFFFRRICGVSSCHGLEGHIREEFGTRDSFGALKRYPKETDYWLDLVRSWGIPVPAGSEAVFQLPISDNDRSRVQGYWTEANIDPDAVPIAICPGSNMPSKRWAYDNYKEEIGRASCRERV